MHVQKLSLDKVSVLRFQQSSVSQDMGLLVPNERNLYIASFEAIVKAKARLTSAGLSIE